MIAEIFDYLLAAYAAELAVATLKGYPSWARPEASLPCVALEFAQGAPFLGRVGQKDARFAIGFRGWLFARNEPELLRLLDLLIIWHSMNGLAFDIAARRVDCGLQEVQRHVPETTNQQERYAVTFLVVTNY